MKQLYRIDVIAEYKHIKSGKTYSLLSYAKMEKDGSEVAVYMPTTGGIVWVRPLDEFREKFKPLYE